MKRAGFNAELLKGVSSQKEIKRLLLQIKTNKEKIFFNDVDAAALIISALKSKIKKPDWDEMLLKLYNDNKKNNNLYNI